MRTTIVLDDDVLLAARSLARARSSSLGAAVSELARKGLQPSRVAATPTAFPVFDVPPDAPTITMEAVRALEDEPW
ncbi:MAG: antitoxin [Armatimonadetes bacterium]|nr:antitoxin [Armatimonadota bacterium]